MNDWLARDYATLWHPFTQHDEWVAQAENLVIVAGEGSWLIDSEGRRYLDAVSSLWCNVWGHRHPAIDAAIRAQLDRIAHTTLLGLTHPPAIGLAERLAALTGLPRVFFSDSGSTAVEVALKIAFQHQQQRGETQRTRFAALTEAYHGDTIGSVSVGGIDLFHSIYRPMLFDAVRIPSPTRPDPVEEAACLAEAERLFAEHGATLAAIVVEPLVQGAAGMRMHSEGWLAALAALARRFGVLVIADEVATGFGRTGTMFASTGIRPDVLCLAKGVTGGYLPLAATLVSEDVFAAFRGPYTQYRTLFHGHTYSGNPLACAAALATLDLFDGVDLRAKERELGAAIATLDHPWVREVRQKGVMAAIVLGEGEGRGGPAPAAVGFAPERRVGHRVSLAARRHGAIVRNLGDAVVLMPPLSMTAAEMELAVAAVGAAIRDVDQGA